MLESQIKDVISKKMEDGTVERLISENLEKGINSSLENLFRSYGDLTKLIEGKIKEVMVQQISGYDFSKYIIKLDYVLTEILQNTSLDNKKILENFKRLMASSDIPKEIKVSEIFDNWCKHVSKNISTDNLEICTDDEPRYYSVDVSFEVIEDTERPSWSSYEYATIVFECEKDEDMNIEIRLSRWNKKKDSKENGWDIEFKSNTEISSLRYLDEFKIFIIQLVQNSTKVVIDEWSNSTEIEPDAEPEADVTYR